WRSCAARFSASPWIVSMRLVLRALSAINSAALLSFRDSLSAWTLSDKQNNGMISPISSFAARMSTMPPLKLWPWRAHSASGPSSIRIGGAVMAARAIPFPAAFDGWVYTKGKPAVNLGVPRAQSLLLSNQGSSPRCDIGSSCLQLPFFFVVPTTLLVMTWRISTGVRLMSLNCRLQLLPPCLELLSFFVDRIDPLSIL